MQKGFLVQLKNFFVSHGMSSDLAYLSSQIAVLVMVVAAAILANWLAKRVIINIINKIISATKTKWDDLLIENRVFHRLAHIAPAIIIYVSSEILFPDFPYIKLAIKRIAFAYMILVGALTLDALLSILGKVLQTVKALKDHPTKTYIQVLKIALYFITCILIIASLIDRSPWALLSGLGAMTAILMLVFKDSILGFVASIQISAYDLIKVGDWISFPKYGVDGDVIDISLNVIRIQNWDKTISVIPTHAFMADSYKNWRGMSESGGRRIKRSINIDMTSVRFLRDDDIAKFKKIHLLRGYIEKKLQEIETYNKEHNIDRSVPVNGRWLTNLGTFRAYMYEYLKEHSKTHKEMTLMVRLLAPTTNGIPVEIYCFSNDTAWVNYEKFQSDIFDHILAILPEFDLRVFQLPTGNDIAAVASKFELKQLDQLS